MDSYPGVTPVWDLSQASTFSQLPDDDFLALLQKQFPTSNTAPVTTFDDAIAFPDGINPQNISNFNLPDLTPFSEDSSPSPASAGSNEQPNSRRQSTIDMDDTALKRKASDDDMSEGPTQKNQHTANGNKKNASRRKSSGGTQDEGRLLKRKEQNRAAQRAFRERKEKHVKDLEDKVAALEAKNEHTQSENENLRDLLSRLQTENVMLKQSSFTFQVPKTAGSSSSSQSPIVPRAAPFPSRSPSTATTPGTSSQTSPKSTYSTDAMDWNSLTTFDPSVLKLLDDNTPQTTATDGAMIMDFGFGGPTNSLAKTPYTTLASNPQYMSFADLESPSSSSDSVAPFTFDMQTMASWPSQTDINVNHDSGSLDEMFGGNYLGSAGLVDFAALIKSPPSAISPISHTDARSPPLTSGSSPSSVSNSSFNKDSPSADPIEHNEATCPKTKAEAAKLIAQQGSSPFAPTEAGLHKGIDDTQEPVIMCKGANFPMTQKSEKNIEVLSAWRSITQNPRFKDTDINELCTEFTNKAKCDGTKVVLEPQGVHHILESLSSKQKEHQLLQTLASNASVSQ